jgi:hypothetical protein
MCAAYWTKTKRELFNFGEPATAAGSLRDRVGVIKRDLRSVRSDQASGTHLMERQFRHLIEVALLSDPPHMKRAGTIILIVLEGRRVQARLQE